MSLGAVNRPSITKRPTFVAEAISSEFDESSIISLDSPLDEDDRDYKLSKIGIK